MKLVPSTPFHQERDKLIFELDTIAAARVIDRHDLYFDAECAIIAEAMTELAQRGLVTRFVATGSGGRIRVACHPRTVDGERAFLLSELCPDKTFALRRDLLATNGVRMNDANLRRA